MSRRGFQWASRPVSGTINAYPRDLRGFAQNRWGGHQSQRLRGYKPQSSNGPRYCRTYTAEEIKEVEADLRRRGII
jgi:hypothetical protein